MEGDWNFFQSVSLEQCLVLWLQRLNTPCLPWPHGQGIHTSFSLFLFRKRASCITHSECGTLKFVEGVRLTFMLVRHALSRRSLRLFRVLGTSQRIVKLQSVSSTPGFLPGAGCRPAKVQGRGLFVSDYDV
jgi:hypothetical protein